jgi:cell wall-associated NlpC family hydrolase
MQRLFLALVLSDLGRDALKVATGLGLAAVLALAFAVTSVAALIGVATPSGSAPSAAAGEIPPDQLPVIRAAAASCGLPWEVLAAVARVESEFGRNMRTSSAGAIGYGQFLPSSWAAYGAGGNPYDYRDALPAMARYLCAHGGAQDIRRALFAYNRANWYVDQVLAVAAQYREPTPRTASSAPSAGDADGLGSRAVALARTQIGKPYVWGGASPQTSFDCSGLVQWVYGQLGVRLPRTAQQQYGATARVSRDDLQVGDLLFFTRTYPSREPITHVGIYVGDGQMVNAPTAGDVVRVMPAFSGFWGAHYAGAGRVRG